MQSNKISIIIPVIRPDKIEKCVTSIYDNCGLDIGQYEIITLHDEDRIGCPEMVKKLTEIAQYDLVCFLGDDTLMEKDCLKEALAEMTMIDGQWGLVGLNDGSGRKLPTHWLAHKKLLGYLDGEFFSTEYNHCYCDNELMDRAKEIDRYIYCKDAKITHDHPKLRGELPDTFEDLDYKRVYSDEYLEADRQTYIKRKRQRLKRIAIGFPLVDSTVHVRFFTSFACMEKPSEYALIVPQFPHGPYTGSLADARNSLVSQAQKEGAEYLLMLDTDQVYPSDTLTKLLSNKKDICGVRVHRRWMPFDPIFLRGEIGKFKNVPDEEAYSGEIIEIDATGTGCLLFKMEVFDKVPAPWFEFTFKNGKPVGEDINFCDKAKRAGLSLFVDTSIEVGHLTTMEVDKNLHQMCKYIKPKIE